MAHRRRPAGTLTMRLSVVVPALNEERNVARAVASARVGAGADGCEVVVVDGGSDDATVSAAHRAGADLVLVSPERGRAAQLARGVERASGDVIVFLHADSTLPDAYAERMHDAMRPEHTWGAFGFRLGSSSDDDEASAGMLPSTIRGHRTEEPMARQVPRVVRGQKDPMARITVRRSRPVGETRRADERGRGAPAVLHGGLRARAQAATGARDAVRGGCRGDHLE